MVKCDVTLKVTSWSKVTSRHVTSRHVTSRDPHVTSRHVTSQFVSTSGLPSKQHTSCCKGARHQPRKKRTTHTSFSILRNPEDREVERDEGVREDWGSAVGETPPGVQGAPARLGRVLEVLHPTQHADQLPPREHVQDGRGTRHCGGLRTQVRHCCSFLDFLFQSNQKAKCH